jgi:hypothetical protein
MLKLLFKTIRVIDLAEKCGRTVLAAQWKQME